jgi:hypothetical protein
MRGVTWWMVALLLANTAHAASANRVPLVQTDRGRVYLRGALIPPPYTVSVGFHMERADTIWDQVYVNDYPMDRRSGLGRPTAADSLLESRLAAARVAARGVHVPPSGPTLESSRAFAAAYASLDTMVDSARAESAYYLVVHWRGVSRPFTVYPYDWHRPSRTQQSRFRLLDWRALYAVPLEDGCVVVAADRGVLCVKPDRVKRFDRELAKARRGHHGRYQLLSDERLRADLVNPKPLPPQER